MLFICVLTSRRSIGFGIGKVRNKYLWIVSEVTGSFAVRHAVGLVRTQLRAFTRLASIGSVQ